MTDSEKFKEIMDEAEEPYEVSDEEILMGKEEVKKPEQIEQDDEKIDELLMLQEWDEEKKPLEYGSVEEKYEEQLLLDHVEKMVAKYMERERRP